MSELAREELVRRGIRLSYATIGYERAIRKFEDDHDRELDAMLALLWTVYSDTYLPQTNPENDFTTEILRKPGTDYAGVFLAAAVKSEQAAVWILNNYLPNAKKSQVRTFAQKLRSEEAGEMAALRRALSNH
jgi:hypothetical protein